MKQDLWAGGAVLSGVASVLPAICCLAPLVATIFFFLGISSVGLGAALQLYQGYFSAAALISLDFHFISRPGRTKPHAIQDKLAPIPKGGNREVPAVAGNLANTMHDYIALLTTLFAIFAFLVTCNMSISIEKRPK